VEEYLRKAIEKDTTRYCHGFKNIPRVLCKANSKINESQIIANAPPMIQANNWDL
jgi:hypothetical protein